MQKTKTKFLLCVNGLYIVIYKTQKSKMKVLPSVTVGEKYFSTSMVRQLTSNTKRLHKMFGHIVTVKCALFILLENNCMRVAKAHWMHILLFHHFCVLTTWLINYIRNLSAISILKNSPHPHFEFDFGFGKISNSIWMKFFWFDFAKIKRADICHQYSGRKKLMALELF